MKQCKILVFLLSLLLIFNTATASSLYPDIEGYEYEEAINLLSVLGIMEGEIDGAFNPEAIVTRREFVVVVCKMLGMQESAAQATDTRFSDVPADDPASGSIKTAADLRIIRGHGDGKFYPDEPITYGQIIKALICALGYEFYAEEAGGYPSGYVTIANQKKLMPSVGVALDETVSRGMLAQLVHEALHIGIFKPVSFGDQIRFTTDDNVTLLSENLNIEKGIGRVVATGDTALTGTTTLSDNEVMIDRRIYKIGNTDAKKFLGYNITYYANDDKNPTLVYISAQGQQNSTLEVRAQNIEQGTTKEALVYRQDESQGRQLRAPISETVDVIFNGMAYPSYTDDDFKPKAGSVKLIDSDRNGEYDTAFITSYRTYVVNSVNIQENTITDKYGQPTLKLDLFEDGVYFVKNGRGISINTVKEWNVLSVAESKCGKLVTIDVSDASVTGTITEMETEMKTAVIGGEDGEDEEVSITAIKAIYVNDVRYELAESFTDSLSLDLSGTFYLNVEGYVAGLSKDLSGKQQWAYLIDAAPVGNLTDKCSFKIFNSEGTLAVYNSAKNIQIDGVPIKNPEDIMELLSIQDEEGETRVNPQVVKIIANGDGEIRYIDTVMQGANENEDNVRLSSPLGIYQFKNRERSFGAYGRTKFIAGNDTVIIYVPTDRNDEKNYSIKKIAEFTNDSQASMEAYNASSGLVPEMILQIGGGSTINASTTLTLVEKVTSGVNEDGELIDILYCGTRYSSVTGIFKIHNKDDSRLNVKPGDVIRLARNDVGEIGFYDKVYSHDGSDAAARLKPLDSVYEYGANEASISYPELRLFYGRIEAKDVKNGTFVVRTPAGSETVCTTTISAPIYVYDNEKKKVSIGSNDDLLDYEKYRELASYVIVRTRYGDTSDIIVFK